MFRFILAFAVINIAHANDNNVDPTPEESCWDKYDDMGCQDRTKQYDVSTVLDCKESCSTDPECEYVTWYDHNDEHEDPFNGCFHSYSSCRETASTKGGTLYKETRCPASWSLEVKSFNDTSSLNLYENNGDITPEFKFQPSDTFDIVGSFGKCEWDFVKVESENGITLTTRPMTYNDFAVCFEQKLTDDHVVFHTIAELAMVYQGRNIVTIRFDVIISYTRRTTAILEFSVNPIHYDRGPKGENSFTESEAFLYEDEKCQVKRTNPTYYSGDNMYFRHVSTNKNIQLGFHSAELIINEEHTNINKDITVHLNGCLEMLAPFKCVGQNCKIALTSDITEHVGTRRSLLSLDMLPFRRSLTDKGSNSIYLEFHVINKSYTFPLQSLLILVVGIGIGICCYAKFFKKSSKEGVGIQGIATIPQSEGQQVYVNGVKVEVDEELGEQGSTLLQPALNGRSRGTLKPIANGPPTF